MNEKINIEELIVDVEEAFRNLAGDFLELTEGYFKSGVDSNKWNGFRKLCLDLINARKRYIKCKLEGRNYYHFTVKERKENK